MSKERRYGSRFGHSHGHVFHVGGAFLAPFPSLLSRNPKHEVYVFPLHSYPSLQLHAPSHQLLTANGPALFFDDLFPFSCSNFSTIFFYLLSLFFFCSIFSFSSRFLFLIFSYLSFPFFSIFFSQFFFFYIEPIHPFHFFARF